MALFAVLTLAACAKPAPEQQAVSGAAAALGGLDELMAVKTLVIEGEGTQYNLGQDVVPGASGQTFAVTSYKRLLDVAENRMRTELVRVPRFTFWQGLAPQRQIQGLDEAIAYNVSASGAATRAGQSVADDRRAEFLRHPVTSVRAAMDQSARVTNLRTEKGQQFVDVTTADGLSFTLGIDAGTRLPARVVTAANHTNLGDVLITTTFADYQRFGAVQLPARLTTSTDDFVTSEVRVTRHVINAEAGELRAPPAVASAPPPAQQPINVTVEDVSPGVWLLAGGSHHSALVEFSDHLMLIDAPQNDARAQAVIAKARELRPAKPLTHVVNSHHHFDHSGGIRAAIAEGLTVITHEGNARFIEEIARRPHTRVPDALAKKPAPLKLETVADEKVVTDGKMTVHLFPAPGEHSETMLIAYLPRERALIVIDLYEPGEAVHMFARRFLDDLEKRNLRVERIIPLHGKIVPYAQLIKDAGQPARK